MIGILGLLATVAVPLVSGVPDAAKKRKLEQDVAIVNNAIDSYLASGGDAANLTSDNVISALKSRVTGGVLAEMTGPRGPFLDTRVITNSTDFAWSALFTTDPHPRFYVAKSTNGVVFDKGPATAVGGVAERPDAARPSWLWTYGEASAPAESEAFVPLAVDSGVASTNAAQAAVTLGAPIISPSSLTANLWAFPKQVTIANTNAEGSSRVYYKIGNGNYTLFDDTPFSVDPGASVAAVCVSLDPSRYYNSAASYASYSVIPLALAVRIDAPASVTYAQAGGLMQGLDQMSPAQATITLEDTANLLNGNPDNLLSDEAGDDKYIPGSYVKSVNFTVRYTTDGSDPLTSQTAQTAAAFNGYFSPVAVSLALAAWGTNSVLPIRAAAVAVNTNWFLSSPVVSASASINPTALPSPTITPGADRFVTAIPVTVSNSTTNVPVGMLSYYTTNGSTPAAGSGVSFATAASFSMGPLAYGATGTVKAAAYGPTDYSRWFTASSVNSITYSGPNYTAGTGGGVLITGGTFANNSAIRGSVIVASVATGTQPNLTLANNGSVTGDVFLPGTPTVTGIATNRVINLDGPVNPTNYTFAVGGGTTTIGGNVYRRITPTPLPAVTNPTGLVTRSNQSSGTLLPGSYNTVSPGNNQSITLGIAGATNPAVYSITNFTTGNNVTVNVVGPVILTLNPGASKTISIANNVVVGNVSHPEWLQFSMYSGNLDLGNNGTLYAAVSAPNGTVTFENNAIFRGSVTAKTFNLENNGSGIVFTLPPTQ